MKRHRLPNPTARSTPEWVGRTPDSMPPMSVILRILVRQDGKCAISGLKIRDVKRSKVTPDHITPLADGGKNVESNIQIVLRGADKEKTSRESTRRAKANRARKAALGLKSPKGPPLESRNDLPAKDPSKAEKAHARIERLLPPRRGGLAVRFGIVKEEE